MQPIIVYRGPSAFPPHDDIVAYLYPYGTKKTGHGVLGLTIIPAAVLAPPYDGNWNLMMRQGKDAPVCGTCPRRSKPTGGDGYCYVRTGQTGMGITAVLTHHKEAFRASSYIPIQKLEAVSAGIKLKAVAKQFTILRSAVWGDAAAIPKDRWESIVRLVDLPVIGYTHAWRRPQGQHLRDTHMASCDSCYDVCDALRDGWRVFHVTAPGARPEQVGTDLGVGRERIQHSFGWCPASHEWAAMGKPVLSCAECQLCVGRGKPKARNVIIWDHSTTRSHEFMNAIAALKE